MKVYISGKISGKSIFEAKKEFLNAESYLRKFNHEPINPFNNGLHESASWEEHMKEDIRMLMDCDAIYTLSDWESSKGSTIEVELAKALNFKFVL